VEAYSPERRPWRRINALYSHLNLNMLRNNALFLEKPTVEYSSGAYKSWGRINTHCSYFKDTILSKNVDQHMLKNALFFRKAGKIAAALKAPPSNPVGLRRLGALLPDLFTCYFKHSYFKYCANFSASLKLRPIASLSDG